MGFRVLDKSLPFDEKMTNSINSLNEANHMIATIIGNKANRHSYAAKIRFIITKTQYTLLSIGGYSHPIHELCRMVLLLFSESMVNESPPRLPICDILAARFQALWEDSLDNDKYFIPLDFKLWAMFVGASTVSATNSSLMELYLRSIVDIVRVMDIESWQRLVLVFSAFLWDNSVHESRYLEIWSDAQQLWHQDLK